MGTIGEGVRRAGVAPVIEAEQREEDVWVLTRAAEHGQEVMRVVLLALDMTRKGRSWHRAPMMQGAAAGPERRRGAAGSRGTGGGRGAREEIEGAASCGRCVGGRGD